MMNSHFNTKYPPVPYSITNLEFSKDTVRDNASPFSLLEFIKTVSKLTDSANITDFYNDYIILWNKKKQLNNIDTKIFFVNQCTEFIKDIALKHSTEAERKFLSSVDYTDKYDLDIILSFISRKIKEIAIYYSKVREDVKHESTRKKLKSSSKGIAIAIKEKILEFFKKKDIVGYDINENIQKININIDELYDAGTAYLDKPPAPYIYDNADRDYTLDIFLESNEDLLSLVYQNIPTALQQYREEGQIFDNKRSLTTKYMGADFYFLSAVPVYSQSPIGSDGTLARGRIQAPTKTISKFEPPIGWDCITKDGKKVCVEAVGGVYTTEQKCKAACSTTLKYGWNCVTVNGIKGCTRVINGVHATERACKTACKTTINYGWNCIIIGSSRRCTRAINGTYETIEQCQAVCQPPTTRPPLTTRPPTFGYNCKTQYQLDGGTVKRCIYEQNGQYKTSAACEASCKDNTTRPPTTRPGKNGYICVNTGDTASCRSVKGGIYKSIDDCLKTCKVTTRPPPTTKPPPCKKIASFVCMQMGMCVTKMLCVPPLSSFGTMEECMATCTTKPPTTRSPETRTYECFEGRCRSSEVGLSLRECAKNCKPTTRRPPDDDDDPPKPPPPPPPPPKKPDLRWRCMRGGEAPVCKGFKFGDPIPLEAVTSIYNSEQNCKNSCRMYWVCRGTNNRRVTRIIDSVEAVDPRSYRGGIFPSEEAAALTCNLGTWNCEQRTSTVTNSVPIDEGLVPPNLDNTIYTISQNATHTIPRCFMVVNGEFSSAGACMQSSCFSSPAQTEYEIEQCGDESQLWPYNDSQASCTTCNPCALRARAQISEVFVSDLAIEYDTLIELTSYTSLGGPCGDAANFSYNGVRANGAGQFAPGGSILTPNGVGNYHIKTWSTRDGGAFGLEGNDKNVNVVPTSITVDWQGDAGAGSCVVPLPQMEYIIPWSPNTFDQDPLTGAAENVADLKNKLRFG